MAANLNRWSNSFRDCDFYYRANDTVSRLALIDTTVLNYRSEQPAESVQVTRGRTAFIARGSTMYEGRITVLGNTYQKMCLAAGAVGGDDLVDINHPDQMIIIDKISPQSQFTDIEASSCIELRGVVITSVESDFTASGSGVIPFNIGFKFICRYLTISSS